VKLENILYRTNAIDSPVVLVDFGISRIFRDKRRLMTSAVGSPWYLAPEQIKRLYDEKCDVWALGVCVFWILSGHPPFGWREMASTQRKHGKESKDRVEQLIGQAIMKAIVTAEGPPPCVRYGVKRVSPTVVSSYIYLQPILTSIIAAFSGTETITIMMVISSIIIFIGVYLVSKPSK